MNLSYVSKKKYDDLERQFATEVNCVLIATDQRDAARAEADNLRQRVAEYKASEADWREESRAAKGRYEALLRDAKLAADMSLNGACCATERQSAADAARRILATQQPPAPSAPAVDTGSWGPPANPPSAYRRRPECPHGVGLCTDSCPSKQQDSRQPTPKASVTTLAHDTNDRVAPSDGDIGAPTMAAEAPGDTRPPCDCGPTKTGPNDHRRECWLSWVARATAAEAEVTRLKCALAAHERLHPTHGELQEEVTRLVAQVADLSQQLGKALGEGDRAANLALKREVERLRGVISRSRAIDSPGGVNTPIEGSYKRSINQCGCAAEGGLGESSSPGLAPRLPARRWAECTASVGRGAGTRRKGGRVMAEPVMIEGWKLESYPGYRGAHKGRLSAEFCDGMLGWNESSMGYSGVSGSGGIPPAVLSWLIRPLLHEAWRAGCEKGYDASVYDTEEQAQAANPHTDPAPGKGEG